jgi:hypothetical protein
MNKFIFYFNNQYNLNSDYIRHGITPFSFIEISITEGKTLYNKNISINLIVMGIGFTIVKNKKL